MTRLCPQKEITLSVTLTIKLEADAGSSKLAFETFVEENLERIRTELTDHVTLRADFWSAYINDNDQVCVDDVVSVERNS